MNPTYNKWVEFVFVVKFGEMDSICGAGELYS